MLSSKLVGGFFQLGRDNRIHLLVPPFLLTLQPEEMVGELRLRSLDVLREAPALRIESLLRLRCLMFTKREGDEWTLSVVCVCCRLRALFSKLDAIDGPGVDHACRALPPCDGQCGISLPCHARSHQMSLHSDTSAFRAAALP